MLRGSINMLAAPVNALRLVSIMLVCGLMTESAARCHQIIICIDTAGGSSDLRDCDGHSCLQSTQLFQFFC